MLYAPLGGVVTMGPLLPSLRARVMALLGYWAPQLMHHLTWPHTCHTALQVFNAFVSRRIGLELDFFKGVLHSPIFLSIMVGGSGQV